MRPGAHRARRRRLGNSRGATITEYAIILFLVAVVGATGFRFFGAKLQGGTDAAGANLESSSSAAQGDPHGGGAGGAGGNGHGGGAGGGAAGGGGGDPTAVYGGARVPIVAQEGTPFAKFAMIALGIIGAAIAFFAAMKGKHAR